MDATIDIVCKVGSMALIRREDQDMDYNVFARLGKELRPGMILVTSGATEIGRLDYIRRTGSELNGDTEEDKADYAAQGQAVLMQTYRQFVAPEYGLRQVLVEHTHFNDPEKCAHLLGLFHRAAEQGTIPVVNYNDAVSDEENRKMELAVRRRAGTEVHECVDNDETAAVIAGLVHARILVLMTSTEGIYRVPGDPGTLVEAVEAHSAEELTRMVRELQESCVGASRAGANGAKAKLEYALASALKGSTVIIGHARHHLTDLVKGNVRCTRIGLI